MRISDWSSDVCSSDLEKPHFLAATLGTILTRSVTMRGFIVREFWHQRSQFLEEVGGWIADGRVKFREDVTQGLAKIGRASCRERVCQYGSISVVAVSLKKKKQQTCDVKH